MDETMSANLLSSIADILSIFAFSFTLYAFFKIRGINGRLVMRSRQGKWLSNVRKRAAEVARTLGGTNAPSHGGEFDPDLYAALSKTRPLVRAIRAALPMISHEWRFLLVIEARIACCLGTGFIRFFSKGRTSDQLPRLIYGQLLEIAEYLGEVSSQSTIYQEGA